jgi:c-di-GMP-binding flagellar brake protein YcgR
MKAIEKELKKFHFPQILVDLHRNRKTGTLTVNTADVTKKVCVEKGNAVFASSTDEDERLGETLIKLGQITFEQYDRSVELLKETGKRQGTILVELGYLTPKDLVLGVKSQVREIIYSLFQIEDAEYEFDEGQLPNREVITLQMSMGNLIYEGMKRIKNFVRIKREMPDMNAVLKLNEEPMSVFQDIVFSLRDKAMLAMIDGTKTVKELIDGTSVATFEAMKTLYVLYVTGFIEEQKNEVKPEEQITVSDEPPQPLDIEGDAFDDRVNELYSNLYKLSPHDLIEIDEKSDANTVQRNFYRLTKEFHPDQYVSSTDPLMMDKLIIISEEIQKAYMLLMEDDKRRDYFQALSSNPQDAGSEQHEEQFKSELSKISEEIFFSRDVPDEPDTEIKGNGESVYETASAEPPAQRDYTVEEHYEEAAAQMNEEIPSSVKAYLEADNDISRDDIDTQEQTPEFTHVNTEPEDSQPDDAKQLSLEETMAEIEQKEETQETRRHRRFKVHDADVSGEMFLSKEVHLIDISVSGIALKVDRQLKVGREYVLNLHAKDEVISVNAEVVRSTLSESKTDSAGNIIPLYLVGMEFKNVSPKRTEEIAEFINDHKIDEVKIDTGCILSGTRLHARVHIDSTDNHILDLQTRYKVKVISIGGMLIDSEQSVSLNDTVQMKISLPEDRSISFLGRIVSCREIDMDPERYDIGIEFIEISEEDKRKLQLFLQVIADTQEPEVTPDRSDDLNKEMTEQLQMDANESGTPVLQEEYAGGMGANGEVASGEAVNRQLLNLIEEIKALLQELRKELPGATGPQVTGMEEQEESESTKELPYATDYENIVLPEKPADEEQKISREEHKAEYREEIPKKKKLKLWHLLIPVLFLIAATISFMFVYTPEKQQILPQQAETKKEILPPATKTQEVPPPPAPEVKKVSPVAATQAVQHTIELIATDSTWLSATIDEKESKEMILKPGDRIKWTAKSNISLIIGNAEGLKVIFDGKELGPLGGKGKVVKLKLPSHKNS